MSGTIGKPRRNGATDSAGRGPGFSPEEERRIELATKIRDTDRIPKVDQAGQTILRDGARLQVMHCGVLIEEDCYYGAWMTEVIRRLRGHHEPQEEAVFHEVVQRLVADSAAPVMVELGSYWAYYSLWLKKAHPAATCILVEPDPNHMRVGQRNFALNSMEGRFIPAGASKTHGTQVSIRCESDGIVRDVPTVSVDGLLASEELERIDIVLCDVQGAELEVLRGACETIREKRVRFLVVSTHLVPGDPALHQRCLAMLQGSGAQIIAEHSIPESCSVDGLIVASCDPRDLGWTVDITIGRARDSLGGELEWRLAAMMGWRGLARQVVCSILGYRTARMLRDISVRVWSRA